MTFEVWFTFALSYLVLSLIPGPSVLMVVAQALSHGRKAALLCVLGDVAGGVVIIAFAYLGLGLVLEASALAFQALKWAGVAYLVWTGMQQILSARKPIELERPLQTGRKSIMAGFWTGVLNPKAIFFYMALFAQFINPETAVAPQVLGLAATSSTVVAVVLGAYALGAVKLRQILSGQIARRRMGYASGGCLLGGSAVLAWSR